MNNDDIQKIDGFSLTWILVNLMGTTAALFIPFSAATIAGHDAWMAPFVGALYGAYAIYIAYRLANLFPGKTFFEYLPLIVGKAAGKVLGLAYIVFLFYLTSSVIREFVALLYGTGTYKLTPPIVILLIFMAATTYVVLAGIEVLGRTVGIYAFIISIIVTVFIIMAIPYMKFDALLPWGEAGLKVIVKSEVVGFAYRSELFVLGMILPYIRSNREGYIAANIANLVLTYFMVIIIIAMITVLGVETTSRSIYAVFFLADFIPPIGIKVFLVTTFVAAFWGKIAVLQFALSDGIAKTFGLKSYHYIALPVAALLLALSFSFYNNIPDMLVSIPKTFPGVALFFGYLIPTLLLLIAWLRSKFGLMAYPDQPAPTVSDA
ncbi:MAG: GerAB/ArcD/ProY family transporter [Deltaproteobacteria bacterium]